MNISIFGTGYVGLVTGACLAESGHDVHCIDVDKDKIDLLNSGQIAIHEPGLKALVASNLAAERIHFSRSEEHTSELQSRTNLVCRLLLEKKKNHHIPHTP